MKGKVLLVLTKSLYIASYCIVSNKHACTYVVTYVCIHIDYIFNM